MVKRVRRLVSGSCQVARICNPDSDSNATHTNSMTKALWHEWSTSKKLQSIFVNVADKADLDIEATAADICRAKNIEESPVIFNNLKKCLVDIRGVNELIAVVKRAAAEKFDSSNAQHEQKLELLWQTLLPGRKRVGGRMSKDWGDIGFQQSDPASDFRSAGVLGLDQLIYIAQTRTRVAQRMIREPGEEASRYPWACVGINLTIQAIRVLESRVIDHTLYGKSVEQGMDVFNALYSDMFEILHARWVAAKPANVMSFPPLLKEALKEIDDELAKKGMLVPPGA